MATLPAFPRLTGDEAESVRLIVETVRRFVRELDTAGHDAAGELPGEVLSAARELGLFSLTLPSAYGGLGLGSRGYCRVIEEVAGRALGLAVTMGAHQGIGCRGIVLYGNDRQKERYLPRCASTEPDGWYAALAMTEPGAGSALADTKTTAVQREDGRWVLNGSKTFITNGGIAHVFTVLARANPRSAGSRPGLSSFVVERAHGARSGPPMDKLGIRESNTTELFFDDTVVPEDGLLGGVGEGLDHAKGILRYGRLTLTAGAVGISKYLLGLSREHALTRVVGGAPIARYDIIREKIAGMVSRTYAADAMLCLTARLLEAAPDEGFQETAMAKIFTSEVVSHVANEALQVAGGSGYLRDLPYERLLRGVRIMPIFEGTNEVLRVLVAVTAMRGAQKTWLRRLCSALGETSGPFAPSLAPVADEVFALLGSLESTLEALHRRYRHEMSTLQSVHKRLADAHILSFAMVSALARAAAAKDAGTDAWRAKHLLPAQCFCRAACREVEHLLTELQGDVAAVERDLGEIAYDLLPDDALLEN